MARLVERTKKIVVGDPTSEDSQMGAIIQPPDNKSGHFDRVKGYIERAKADSRNTLVYGGEQVSFSVFVAPVLFVCFRFISLILNFIF